MEEAKLKTLAGPTVEFLGNLTDEELKHYYQHCRALLFPQEEDFGIVAVEAMSCGKPVIAYRQGGAGEIIKEGVTGEFFYPQTVAELKTTLEKSMQKTYSTRLCEKQADLFSMRRFQTAFAEYIKEEWNRFRR